MPLYLKNDLSYEVMNVPTPITSPQQLIICKVSSEEDSIILLFMSRSPTFCSKYSENFHTALKRLSDNFSIQSSCYW